MPFITPLSWENVHLSSGRGNVLYNARPAGGALMRAATVARMESPGRRPANRSMTDRSITTTSSYRRLGRVQRPAAYPGVRSAERAAAEPASPQGRPPLARSLSMAPGAYVRADGGMIYGIAQITGSDTEQKPLRVAANRIAHRTAAKRRQRHETRVSGRSNPWDRGFIASG